MADSKLKTKPLVAGLAAAVVTALAVRAFVIEPASVEVTFHELPVPDLPREWHGARLIHLTDLHYGNPRSERLLAWMVKTVNALEPDLIAITGDFVVRHSHEVGPCLRFLRRLRSRHGILGTLGDHDYHEREQVPFAELVEGLQAAGVHLLRNSAVELPGGLRIAGTDPTTGKVAQANLPAALRDGGPELPHLLLSHSPDIILEASRDGVPLVLCGHTHGGQVVAPGYGPPVTHTLVGKDHASGWSRKGPTRMYTGRGLGSHYSLRFLCRPEIAVFRMVPAPSRELNQSAAGRISSGRALMEPDA